MLSTIKGNLQIGILPFAKWNNLHSFPVRHQGSLPLADDPNGNLVTGDGYFRVYNSFNQLWKVYNGTSDANTLLEEYTYHPMEERILVKKVYAPNASLKETVYYISPEFVRVKNDPGTFDFYYIIHEGHKVGEIQPDGTKIYYHPDH